MTVLTTLVWILLPVADAFTLTSTNYVTLEKSRQALGSFFTGMAFGIEHACTFDGTDVSFYMQRSLSRRYVSPGTRVPLIALSSVDISSKASIGQARAVLCTLRAAASDTGHVLVLKDDQSSELVQSLVKRARSFCPTV